MAKGATVYLALKALAEEGYTGPAIVKITKNSVVAQRVAEVIHMPKSARREEANRIYKDISKHMRDYLRIKNKKGEEYDGGDLLRFVRANVVTAFCGFSWPRYELNSYEAPGAPEITACYLDDENKMRVRVGVRKFPHNFTAGAIRLFFRLNCYSASTGWVIAQVLKFNKISDRDFEAEFVIEGMTVGSYVWGTNYLRFRDVCGGTLHIKADLGGTPDDKTTIRVSKRSADFIFKIPQRVLDARAEKIRQKVRSYGHNGYLKQIERKGIKKLRREKAEYSRRYHRRHRQQIAQYKRPDYPD